MRLNDEVRRSLILILLLRLVEVPLLLLLLSLLGIRMLVVLLVLVMLRRRCELVVRVVVHKVRHARRVDLIQRRRARREGRHRVRHRTVLSWACL